MSLKQQYKLYEANYMYRLIGAGYWGVNLIRNFHRLGVLKAVSDNDKKKKAIQALA